MSHQYFPTMNPISIKHFTHQHPLTLDSTQPHGSYICNGCKTFGTGRRFRCINCNFDLHESCAACPDTLSSFMHPNHGLKLMMSTTVDGGQRFCAVCTDPLTAMFYHCDECKFYLHPLCSLFPETLCHAAHSDHPLRFEFSPNLGTCGICRGPSVGWRYRCSNCAFNIHFTCMVPVRAPPLPVMVPGYNYGRGLNNNLNPRPQNQMYGIVGSLGNRIFDILQQLGINFASSGLYDAVSGS